MMRTADGSEAQKSKLELPETVPPFFDLLTHHEGGKVAPTKINRGGQVGMNDTWARVGRDVGSPVGGMKTAKGRTP